MKVIQNVSIETFDGIKFANLYGIDKLSFHGTPNQDKQTMTLVVPDVVPDDAQTVFDMTQPVTETKKLAEAIVSESMTDDVEWAKLTPDEKLDRIRGIFLKSAALQIIGKVDPTKIDAVASGAIASILTVSTGG